jgi:hypothetical protein
MRHAFPRLRSLAKAGLVSGLLLSGSGLSLGQQPAPATLPPPPPDAILKKATTPSPWAGPANAPVVEGTTVAPAPADGAPADDCKDGEKSPWLKVPPISPFPLTGYFQILPDGPGYYSLKDVLCDEYREKPPKNPYPPVSPFFFSFYDADYRYLDDPNNTQHDWSDCYHRIHLGDNWLFSTGGEERVRYMHEEGGYARFTGKDNDYTLERTRVYGDLWYKDVFRIFVEYYDAQITGEDLKPLPIDVNHSDFLNLFGELKIFEWDDTPAYVRVGRQEMYFGSQRLISPLDWANTRRTFQGVRTYWHSEKLDLDAFWVQPVIVSPDHFDSPDDAQNFMGLWTTYRPQKGQEVDLYYLYLDNTRPVNTGFDAKKGGFNVNTLGARYAGNYEKKLLWDFEGMYQFGDSANRETSAEAYTTALGYAFSDTPLAPQFWINWDFASGNDGPTDRTNETFNQLFPFGHFYFGFLDFVGRQNIEDLSFQGVLFPTHWTPVCMQYHMFRLDSAKDALYNASGTVIRVDPTGKSGTDVGDEIDLFTNIHISVHQDILIGWSKLYTGSYLRTAGGPPMMPFSAAAKGVSPELFYAQYSFKW